MVTVTGADLIAPELFSTNGASDNTSDDSLHLVHNSSLLTPNAQQRSSRDDDSLVDDSIDDNILPLVPSMHDEPLHHY
jgi:hypothetical protein